MGPRQIDYSVPARWNIGSLSVVQRPEGTPPAVPPTPCPVEALAGARCCLHTDGRALWCCRSDRFLASVIEWAAAAAPAFECRGRAAVEVPDTTAAKTREEAR